MPHSQLLPDSIGGRVDFVPPDFVCSWTTGGLDAGWVQVTGELDVATTPELDRTLLEPQLQTHLVVLDLRDLAFIDTCGVHAIVNASIRARKAGHRLVLVHCSPDTNRLFALTGISNDIEIGDIDRSRALQGPVAGGATVDGSEGTSSGSGARASQAAFI